MAAYFMSISAAALEAAYTPAPVATGGRTVERRPMQEVFKMMDPFPPAVEAIAGICGDSRRKINKICEGRRVLVVLIGMSDPSQSNRNSLADGGPVPELSLDLDCHAVR